MYSERARSAVIFKLDSFVARRTRFIREKHIMCLRPPNTCQGDCTGNPFSLSQEVCSLDDFGVEIIVSKAIRSISGALGRGGRVNPETPPIGHL